LQYAHAQQLVRRDVKPGNMLLGRDDEALLSDFGIASARYSSESAVKRGAGVWSVVIEDRSSASMLLTPYLE
jgi:serine/threonine protein kinase